MSQKLRGLIADWDYEEQPIWSPFLDRTDLEMLAEALYFYLQCLAIRDPLRGEVNELINHLSTSCWPFCAKIEEADNLQMDEED